MNENEDFDALRNNLKYLKLSLENERVKAQEKLFLDFTQTVMGMDMEDDRTVLLSQAYMTTVKELADEEIGLPERLQNFINSDFLYTLLTYRNLRYEREIKKFLRHLSELLVTTSKEGETRDFKSLEHFFNRSIMGALDIIEPETAENRELQGRESAEEMLMMSLRLKEGLDLQQFHKVIGLRLDDIVNRINMTNLINAGFLKRNSKRLYTTKKGTRVLNTVLGQLLAV